MEEMTYDIEILDNGAVLTDNDNCWRECEKYSDDGSDEDQSVINLIGRNIWPGINRYFGDNPVTKVKIIIKIEAIK